MLLSKVGLQFSDLSILWIISIINYKSSFRKVPPLKILIINLNKTKHKRTMYQTTSDV